MEYTDDNQIPNPTLTAKMRVGTAENIPAQTDGSDTLPDNLDPHRDLPRYGQVEEKVSKAAAKLDGTGMSAAELEEIKNSQESRALIGDMRNDENLAIAQFHVSFLRFHNRVVDYLENNYTGWIADFDSAKRLEFSGAAVIALPASSLCSIDRPSLAGRP